MLPSCCRRSGTALTSAARAPPAVPAQVHYEDAQAAFNSTYRAIAREFYPRVRGGYGRHLLRWCPLAADALPGCSTDACSFPSPCPSPSRLQDAAAILEAAQECDPTTWSDSQLSSNNHVTAAKHPPGSRERLQAVLAAQPEIAAHLCAVTAALGYEDARCGDDSAAREGGFM